MTDDPRTLERDAMRQAKAAMGETAWPTILLALAIAISYL